MPPKTTIPRNKSWYRFQAKAAGQAELLIYDEIGLWGITAKDFYADLTALGDLRQLDLRINSPGGDVFDGLAIFNILNRHPATVIVTIDGIAASIASVVAMAGDEVVIPQNGLIMVHDPSGVVVGTADDMRDLADALDKVKQGLISAYRAKTGLPDDQLTALLTEETWLTAEEALELGFADRIIDPVKLAARFDLHRFAHPPAALRAKGTAMPPKTQLRSQQPTQDPVPADPNPEQPVTEPPADPNPEPPTEEPPREDPAAVRARDAEIVRLCADAGAPKFAIQAIAQNLSVPTVIARLSSAAEIRTLCATARLPDLAPGFIESGLTTEQVRARLFDQLVARDHVTITSHILPAASLAKPIDSAKIYAARRAASK